MKTKQLARFVISVMICSGFFFLFRSHFAGLCGTSYSGLAPPHDIIILAETLSSFFSGELREVSWDAVLIHPSHGIITAKSCSFSSHPRNDYQFYFSLYAIVALLLKCLGKKLPSIPSQIDFAVKRRVKNGLATYVEFAQGNSSGLLLFLHQRQITRKAEKSLPSSNEIFNSTSKCSVGAVMIEWFNT